MNEKEKTGCYDILRLLPEKELLSLLATVTGRKVVAESKNDAYRAIFAFTMEPAELLRRRKVSRDILIKYCFNQQVKVSATADKPTVIQTILNHWGSDNVQHDDLLLSLERKSSPEPDKSQKGRNNSNDTSLDESQITKSLQPATESDKVKASDTDMQMATAFTNWFYSMLNGNHPRMQSPQASQWGSVHFYPDCKLKLLVSGDDTRREIFEGSDLVNRRLLAFITEESLLFNPNLEHNGVLCRSQQHGLCQILVCGTVHLHSSAVGIFEQHFGLIRDPGMENNWRIKYTNLKLGVCSPSQQPVLGVADNFIICE